MVKNLSKGLKAHDKGVWDRRWDAKKLSPATVGRYFMCVSWRKVSDRILRHFGSFKGLKTIELGSGKGTHSLLMALCGAEATLVDYSAYALLRGKEFFNYQNLDVECYRQDVLNLADDFFSKFDISLSFGLVEHFLTDIERQKVLQAHYDVLQSGGLCFIGVPNQNCPHYRLAMWLEKTVAKYKKSSSYVNEKPFSQKELLMYGRELGFKKIEVSGSSFADLAYTPLPSILKMGIISLKPLDDHLSYGLIFSGTKNEP